MLIFREFFNTQSDQNILQNAPNCTTFSKFSQGASICETLQICHWCERGGGQKQPSEQPFLQNLAVTLKINICRPNFS